MWKSVIAISVGASLGALLRWQLGLKLNSLLPALPLGTLSANLIGAYIIGVAIAYFSQVPQLSPEARLLIITGFCGGLTTFSTFSAEVFTQLQNSQILWALRTTLVHIVGSVLLTFLGFVSFQLSRH
ncbi:MAG: fluoride efflux transporter CrcB [Methylophilus methylotrophus]|uniref:Fluoride-specific ion channel FluC n=1 Tax=Methylophilus methylotrophus TaxID=17 RepID=A0A5C7WJK9_METME|nr:fluoride efflux transporter CrcB [Methylophilus sp.]PPD12764.1 MAG: fluoride efflux transporter CrcB [Methylophilus sp.]TXI37189.1 MAG: fluoride efflux transporter CrcB [Methylophilus methylotrophus]